MRPLITGPEIVEAIQKVVDYAEAHRVSAMDLSRIAAGTLEPPGDNPEHRVWVPVGFRCVFTIEQQPKLGWCRHISVSVKAEGRAPNEVAMETLMKLFGFTGAVRDAAKNGRVWVEQHATAINVVEPMGEISA